MAGRWYASLYCSLHPPPGNAGWRFPSAESLYDPSKITAPDSTRRWSEDLTVQGGEGNNGTNDKPDG